MVKQKVIVVMPAYNAEKTFRKTILDIPINYVDQIVFVDDNSQDNTCRDLEGFIDTSDIFCIDPIVNDSRVPITLIRHEKNKGYGGNQKTCYRNAISKGANFIVMLHPDYQYDPKVIPIMIDYLSKFDFDVVLGSRIRNRREALDGGMPLYKYISNRMLSFIQNIVTGQNLSEWHSGLRAYKKDVLESINFEDFSDDFVFDTQMLFAIFANKYKVGEIPVGVRYSKESSSINLTRSIKYGLLSIWECMRYLFGSFIPKK